MHVRLQGFATFVNLNARYVMVEWKDDFNCAVGAIRKNIIEQLSP